MDYKHAWNLLKSEYGSRVTFDLKKHDCSTIKELMERIEKEGDE